MRLLRYWRFGLAAAITLSASLAFATDPAEPYPVCNRKTSAADQEGAKGAHKAASQFYDRGDYEKAVRYWTDAYGFDCNAHPVLINIANAYEKKGDKAAAVVALETYLKRTGGDATIEEKVKNLKASLQPAPTATVTPTVTPSAALPPLASGAPSAPPLPTGPRPHGITPLVVTGAGGVLVLAGAILVPVGLGNVSTAEKLCPIIELDGKKVRDCGTNKDAENQGNSGRVQVAAGAALLGVGAAVAVGGLVWQFAFNKPKALAPAKTRVHVIPTLSPRESGITVTGTF